MFKFANLNAHATLADSITNSKGVKMYVVRTTIKGVKTHKEAVALLVAKGYEQDTPRKSNWAWKYDPAGGYFERHTSDKEKANSLVAAINGKDAPAKKADKKAEKPATKAEKPATKLPDFSHMTKAEIIAWAMTYTA